MIAALSKWEESYLPAIAVEQTEQQSTAAFWGAIIPAIPDVISQEQFRTGMTYETALNTLLQAQQRWVQQLHGDRRFTISLRIIGSGDPSQNLVFGLVGKTEGQNEPETLSAARNFFNKVRDTFPSGYPLAACESSEQLALLRLPFLPANNGQIGELRRGNTALQTISSKEVPDTTGVCIYPWIAHANDFQDLFRALACHPSPVAVAINLRATELTPSEASYISNQARLYANIANISRQESNQNRVMSSSMTVQEKLLEADQASQAWTKLQATWRSPFEMTVTIMSADSLPESAIAALKASVDGKPANENQQRGKGEIAIATSEVQQMAARQNFVDLTLHRWANSYNLQRLPWLFSPEEVHSVFRLPIRDRNGTWGLPSVAGANDARRPSSKQNSIGEIQLGALSLTKKQLTQHLLICGVPGSGKTNSSLYLLETLWRQRIPWMVLEPAKTEYRGLKSVPSLAKDLLIFSLGDERTAPFRFNPFAVPPTINLDSHLGALVDLFSVAMSMWGPLPNVIEQLIQEAYKRKGFTLLGDNSNLQPPRFSDLLVLIPEIVPKLGYKKETTDEITAAIAVRLNKFCRGALGKILDTTESIPFDELMQRPVILEMSQVTNTDDRAFIMGLILNRCYQYWTARRHEATGELKHLLLVEEAHNLLGNVAESGNQESANPKGKAVKNFANMLAEVRGFGQGIAIAEQNPEGLVPDVMVNTNIKIAHRIVEAKNREALSRAMLLTPQQEKSLASLGTGQMLYYIGGNPEPSLAIAPNFKDDTRNGFNPRLTDAEIAATFTTFRDRYPSLYAPLFGCPTNPEFASCIEQGFDAIRFLSESPQYKDRKQTLILQLLAAPFGAPAKDLVMPTLGQILTERGVNHLTMPQIQAVLSSALSLLALEAVQEKAKVHGWLGAQIDQVHRLLVRSLFEPQNPILNDWINLCRLPDHLLQLSFPHPEYCKSEAAGIFRYENKAMLNGDRSSFTKDMQNRDLTPSQALQNWVAKAIVYPYLSKGLQYDLKVCLAVQLTAEHPEDLQYFLMP